MKPPTDILKQEHTAILRMVDAAEELAQRIQRGEHPPAPWLVFISEFFETFLDRCHHGKEEKIFFPALAQKGLPVEGGPLGVMLREHDEGRRLTAQMRQAADEYARGQSQAVQQWATAARRHGELLREHMLKENSVLFPMAEGLLAPAEQDALAARFDTFEEAELGPGTHEQLHRRMEELLAAMGLSASKAL